VLKRHRTIGRHIEEHKQLLGMASAVAYKDEEQQVYNHQNFKINCKNI